MAVDPDDLVVDFGPEYEVVDLGTGVPKLNNMSSISFHFCIIEQVL